MARNASSVTVLFYCKYFCCCFYWFLLSFLLVLLLPLSADLCWPRNRISTLHAEDVPIRNSEERIPCHVVVYYLEAAQQPNQSLVLSCQCRGRCCCCCCLSRTVMVVQQCSHFYGVCRLHASFSMVSFSSMLVCLGSRRSHSPKAPVSTFSFTLTAAAAAAASFTPGLSKIRLGILRK